MCRLNKLLYYQFTLYTQYCVVSPVCSLLITEITTVKFLFLFTVDKSYCLPWYWVDFVNNTYQTLFIAEIQKWTKLAIATLILP